MSVVGHVESVWRYPIKSMRGEKVASAFVGFAGVYGDRLYAFQSSAAVAGFPFLTAREQAQMLLHQPRFRHPEKALQPPNLAEAEHLAPDLTPVYPSSDDLVVDIVTPDGAVVAIDSPALRAPLAQEAHRRECLGKTEGAGELALLRSDRARLRPIIVGPYEASTEPFSRSRTPESVAPPALLEAMQAGDGRHNRVTEEIALAK